MAAQTTSATTPETSANNNNIVMASSLDLMLGSSDGKLIKTKEAFKHVTGCDVNILCHSGYSDVPIVYSMLFTSWLPTKVIDIELLWRNIVPTTATYTLDSIFVNTSKVSTIFSAEALKAFLDTLHNHKKETASQVSEITIDDKIILALNALKKSYAGFEIQLFNGDTRVEPGDIMLITKKPKMPDIKIKPIVADTINNAEVELRLQIAYQRDGVGINNATITGVRNDTESYPSNGWKKVKTNEEWKVDFGSDIRGGTAYLLCHYGDKTDTTMFYIRGENPSEADIKGYMQQYISQYWFLVRMTRQESSMRQFGNSDNYNKTKLKGKANAKGEPLYGPPRGFGLKQLDNWGNSNNPKQATAQHLWDWNKNIEGGVEVIKEKQKQKEKLKKKEKQIIDDWNDDHQDNMVYDSLLVLGNSTKVLIIEEGANNHTETFAVSPIGNQRDIYDAVWIKMFNGGANYHQIVTPTNVPNEQKKPYRVISREGGYVGNVCNRNN
jgi:hypothetical protein